MRALMSPSDVETDEDKDDTIWWFASRTLRQTDTILRLFTWSSMWQSLSFLCRMQFGELWSNNGENWLDYFKQKLKKFPFQWVGILLQMAALLRNCSGGARAMNVTLTLKLTTAVDPWYMQASAITTLQACIWRTWPAFATIENFSCNDLLGFRDKSKWTRSRRLDGKWLLLTGSLTGHWSQIAHKHVPPECSFVVKSQCLCWGNPKD